MRAKEVASVASLPDTVHGPANLTWWAALGGSVIEGFVLVLAVFVYLYLRHAADSWPPLHTPLPSLGIPTINLGLILLTVVPAWWAARCARRHELSGTLVGLMLHAVIGLVVLVLRYYELRALNVRWDTNAYGSITWAILFSHGYMALFDVFETMGLAVVFARGKVEDEHYVDVTDSSFFWYFVVATWIPLYLLVFFGPRVMGR